jgi:hypothetical protein
MTRSIGQFLPFALVELLDGNELELKAGRAFQCLTGTDDGWPYVAMVSVGELLAVDASALRLAIWSNSSTVRNLDLDERCALALVHEGVSYVIRCEASIAGSLEQHDGPPLSIFVLSIVDVLEDVAPYATLTSGVTYELHEPEAVIARWERTIQALRERS